MRSILNAWKVAIVGIDAQGCIVDWNLRAEAVFGYRREAVLGRQADAQMLAETVPRPFAGKGCNVFWTAAMRR